MSCYTVNNFAADAVAVVAVFALAEGDVVVGAVALIVVFVSTSAVDTVSARAVSPDNVGLSFSLLTFQDF